MQDTAKHRRLLSELEKIVGKKQLLRDHQKTLRYRKGFRCGEGEALAVVFPDTLLSLWKIANCCIEADVIMLMQAANTGLTGGSTPYGEYDRSVIIINCMKIRGIHLINDAKQVVAFPGSRLYELETVLSNYNREPHSVIGSSCIGASVVGGVCNNSGGALVHRGPAYTEMALYARIDEKQKLELVNHLGIDLGDDPETILERLEKRDYQQSDIHQPDKAASDKDYLQRVREVDSDTPARFNNDQRRLYEASGCAGKLIVFALRLDTFPKANRQQVYYIGTNSTAVLTELRRDILTCFKSLPVSGEYLHKSYFDVCDLYGKDVFLFIRLFGTHVMPKLFAIKNYIDRIFRHLPCCPDSIADRLLQEVAALFPDHLPEMMRNYRKKYAHHLILHMADAGVDEAARYLEEYFKTRNGDFFVCSEKEGKMAFLHRFVAGGAVPRYKQMNPDKFGEHISLDIALKRNEQNWFEELPEEIDSLIAEKFYCGHFFCHVMHQDYLLKKGVDGEQVKQQLLQYLDKKGAEYPAEHNVGHVYEAKPALKSFFQKNDPTNSLNPGIGKTSKLKFWGNKKAINKCC